MGDSVIFNDEQQVEFNRSTHLTPRLVAAPRAQQHGRTKSNLDVDRTVPEHTVSQALSDADITELAHSCLALLEVHGQAIERTLADMSEAAGGFLLPADAPKVRAKVEALIRAAKRKNRQGTVMTCVASVSQRDGTATH